jgi:murein DD-endopeptidase MepM/ murein hydrolase activator NlpD
MNKIRYITLCVLATLPSLSSVTAQEIPKPHFGAPFDFPLLLSGNFGELRSGHFHGGLDFKTQETTGWPIYCPADGYISRVTVSNGGYGNGLYITHTNGYTTVYGHLEAFQPRMAERVRTYQLANETYVCDLVFGPDDFPVTEGDIVGRSGNTGYSFGPHLHFEVRLTATNEPVDPLLFYKSRIADDVPPRASSVVLYVQDGHGAINGSSDKLFMNVRGNAVETPATLTAWGKVGAGIAAYDYMTGTHNFYGVQSVKLFVDDELISESRVERFTFDENRHLDAWVDYEERVRTGKWYMRSTVAPNNPLRMLEAKNDHWGWVIINQERDYRFRYELRDIYGNCSVYRFTVKGVRQNIPSIPINWLHYVTSGEPHTVNWKDCVLWLPKDALYEDLRMVCEVNDGNYCFCRVPVPLKENAELRLQVSAPLIADASKYCIAEVLDGNLIYRGGTYEYGWVKTTVSRLGTYTVLVDTVPPVISTHRQASWAANGEISFKLGDNFSGVNSYRGTIDGEWKLFCFSSKEMRLWCNLREEGISRGHHVAEITVTDARGNVSVLEVEFEY